VLCEGIFGVPLDVCAQSIYHAIKAVVSDVSNLSLNEIHLVHDDPNKTQFIQSVFFQLSASEDGGATESENLPPRPSSLVAEPPLMSAFGRSKSVSSAGDKDKEEVFDLRSGNDTLKTSVSRRNRSDEESTEKRGCPTVAEQDLQTCEKILDQEQVEGQEEVSKQYQDLSSEVPEVFIQEQTTIVNTQPVAVQDDRKSANSLPFTNVLSTQDEDSQSFDIRTGEYEQKGTANSQQLIDQDSMKSANKEPHSMVLTTTGKNSQALEKYDDLKDLETGERAGYEEHHDSSSRLEPQLEMFMQELSLEEYREDPPSSFHPETISVVPSGLLENGSLCTKNLGHCCLKPGDDNERCLSLPTDAANQTVQQ